MQAVTAKSRTVALQRTDQFVGRTTNWLYDHLRFVPGYEPFVLTNELVNRDEFPKLSARLINHETLPRRAWRKFNRTAVFPPDLWSLRRLRPALLHSHFGYIAVEDLALARALGIPWVVSFYGADVYQLGRLESWLEKYRPVFVQAARVLALGPVMAEHLERIGCPSERIAVHPLGVDVENLPSAPRRQGADEPLRLLFAGTFREKKGIRYILEAVGLVRRAGGNVTLAIVAESGSKAGDEETRQEALRLIPQLGLDEVVTLHPFLPFRELIELAMGCHVFVAPSVTAEDGDSEGTPFVLQQMMATAMPAIVTIHADIPFLFGDLQSLLVPERDAPAVAARIIDYLNEPEKLAVDGAKLHAQVHGLLNIQRCAAHLSQLYDELLLG